MSRSVPIDHLGKEGFDSKIEVHPRTELVRAAIAGATNHQRLLHGQTPRDNAPTDLYQVLLGQKNTTAVAATELKELVGQRKREGDLEARVGIEPTSCSLRSYKNAYGQAMGDAGWY
jgi:hypothetical protein